jgi:hypothetical protein
MEQTRTAFLKPSSFERVFNRVFGLLVGLGIGLEHNYLLQVRGRKSGKVYSTPVDYSTIVAGSSSYARADARNGCSTPKRAGA